MFKSRNAAAGGRSQTKIQGLIVGLVACEKIKQ
jgi:hypothetical protein